MNPRAKEQAGSNLPASNEQLEANHQPASPEQNRQTAGPATALPQPPSTGAAGLPTSPSLPGTPTNLPSGGSPTNSPNSSLAGATPPVADDVDLIEKEWVLKIKQIIARTKGDPYKQTKAMNHLRADYLKKRYHKDLKVIDG